MFGQRIAQKIWLGYAIPLAVLVVAGVLVPAALSAILGRVSRGFENDAALSSRVKEMEYAVLEAQSHVRGYSLYRDREFLREYGQSRARYEKLRDEAHALAARDPVLLTLFEDADRSYEEWRRRVAEPQARGGRGGDPQGRFEGTRQRFERLIAASAARRDRQARRAQAAERARRVMMVVGPSAALVLALLIGRSIALGVTRPLEELTRATEALERGQPAAALLFEEVNGGDAPPQDEIGELRRAFGRMARTTGQREAVLRAQNEALGSLNRRVEAVLNSTNDGIVLLDRSEAFSIVNQRFADLLGLEAETLLDQTFAQAGPLLIGRFKDKERVKTWLRGLLAEPREIADETFEIVEPEYRVLRVYSAPVRREPAGDQTSGERLGRIFVLRDVTRETTVDRMKTEFIGVVSHELRTPLAAIKGYVDVILAGDTGPLSDLQREFLTMVQGSTDRLAALINDMLDISRIESGRVEVRREALEYSKLVRETVAMLNPTAEAKNIAVAVEAPGDAPPVLGDADRVTQVLLNLVGNAIKYTPPGGKVVVRVESSDTFVTTAVRDTGIGITSDDQTRLFQKFFRADNSLTREAGGTGLGLAITKAIVEKLHGGIWVESAPGDGSTFFFTLPLAEPPPESQNGPADPAAMV